MIRFLSFTLLALTLLTSSSSALISKTARVELRDGQSQVSIGPDMYVIADPEENLTYQTIITRHENNMRGNPNDSRLINLGLGNVASWLVFSVTNNAENENWLLDFGDVGQGRSGFSGALNLQDAESNIEPLPGAIFPLTIKKGESKQYAVYIKPAGIIPHIINPRLIASAASPGSFSPVLIQIMAMMVLIGIFSGFAIVQNRETNILFAVYFGTHLIFLLILEHVFHLNSIFGAQLLSLFFPAAMIAGLMLTKSFLRIRGAHYMENVMIFSLGLFIIVMGLVAILLPQAVALLKTLLLFVPAVLSVMVICALCYWQVKTKKYPASYFGMAWACFLGGLVITGLTGADLLGANEVTVNACWLSLLLQGGFFIAATREQSWLLQTTQKTTQAREIHEAQSMERLRKSKESVDQARLIRVIERERELMAELREREMKRTEEMRKAKIIADKANLAKSSFLAVISHEIRTPMTGILGTVKLLTDTKLSKEQSDLILAIKQSGDTMLSLLNDILDFEKIEKGRMDLEHISFDLPKLVNDVTTLMGGHARDKGIELKSEIGDKFPRLLMGDPTRLRQVLLNLVNNSIKFTEKGNITIRLQEEISDAPEGSKPRHKIFFMVQDTGIGISERAQRNLFNPFQQADETVSRKFGGTGLGLAICKSIIEAMGGQLKVESQLGVGSQFFFTLSFDSVDEKNMPVAKAPAAPQAPKIQVPPLEVLVVEDNEVNRKVIAGFLEKQNHKSTLCVSGEEAMVQLRDKNFDLVFVDIWMSGMSGVETTQAIRNLPDYYKANTPIIAISGNTGAKDIEEYMRAGMNGYLQKPIDYDKLLLSIANIYTNTIEARRKFLPAEAASQDRNSDQAAPVFQFLTHESGELEMTEENQGKGIEEILPVEIDPAVFDGKVLESLRKTLGPEKMTELLNGFIEKADDIVRALKTMSIETEPFVIKGRAHEMKGMAANFGVKELSNLATKIEELAKAGNVADTLPEIEKLSEANQKAKIMMKAWLASPPAN